MSKQYLLLRSNRQTGPFLLHDLLQFNLTPHDLIWADGHSAGWCYPFEVEELKAFIPAPELLAAAPPTGSGEEKIQSAAVTVKAPPAKKIFVSMPGDVKPQKIVELTPSLEKKAEALRQRALNYKPPTTTITNEEPAHKPLASLHKTIQGSGRQASGKKKRHRLTTESFLLFTIAFCAMAVITFFIVNDKPQNISVAQKGPAVKTDAGKGVVKPSGEPPALSRASTDASVPLPAGINTSSKKVTGDATPALENNETAKEAVPQKKPELPSEVLVKYELSEGRQPKGRASDIQVNDLLQTSCQYTKSAEGIGLAITVENKAAQPIRTAAIDVVYFDKAGKEILKQTVYFSNILPRTTLTKNSPFIKAASASYRVGLVSTEKWGLYVMQ